MLKGKVALVTGSTSGIGLQVRPWTEPPHSPTSTAPHPQPHVHAAHAPSRQVLKTLSGAGCDVAMHGLGDQAALQKVLREVGDSTGARTLHSDADLRRPAEIRDMVKQASRRAPLCHPGSRARRGAAASWAAHQQPRAAGAVCRQGRPSCVRRAGATAPSARHAAAAGPVAWLQGAGAEPPSPLPARPAEPPSPPAPAAAQVADYFGRIDILVNNAGIQHVSPVDTFPEDK
jgi:hypothetical protein